MTDPNERPGHDDAETTSTTPDHTAGEAGTSQPAPPAAETTAAAGPAPALPPAFDPQETLSPAPAGPSRSKKFTLIAVAGGVVAAMLAGGILFLTLGGGGGGGDESNGDEAQIKNLVNDFADAIDRNDQQKLISLMCAEEAQDIMDSDGYDPDDNTTVNVPADQKTKITTSDVRVVGDMASAKITRVDNSSDLLYFLKENSQWKVCAPVEARIDASPSPSADPGTP